MGLEEFVKGRASSVDKSEKALFDEFDMYLDPEKKEELHHKNWEGHKGGIVDFATRLYVDTAATLDKVHEKNASAKEKMSPEKLQLTAFETLIRDNLVKLKNHSKAKKWISHYDTLNKKGGFDSPKDKEAVLREMMADVLGIGGEESDQLLNQYAAAVIKGDITGYRSALKKVSQAIEQGAYEARRDELGKSIGKDPLLRNKAQAYFAVRNLQKHKLHVEDSKKYFAKSFAEHAQDYHILSSIAKQDPEKEVKKMGYVPLKKK